MWNLRVLDPREHISYNFTIIYFTSTSKNLANSIRQSFVLYGMSASSWINIAAVNLCNYNQPLKNELMSEKHGGFSWNLELRYCWWPKSMDAHIYTMYKVLFCHFSYQNKNGTFHTSVQYTTENCIRENFSGVKYWQMSCMYNYNWL